MRDVLLTLVIAVILPAILAWPRVGAYAWAWVSLMNPHRLVWGFAQAVPFAQIIAIVTMLRTLFSTKRNAFPINSITVVYLLFLLWMSVTSLFALNTTEIIIERWVFVMKIHIMMFVTLLLLRGRRQIDTLIWVVTLSLAYYGVKGGVFTIITGGEFRVWGPASSAIEGNNELAVALIILVPLIVYLYRTSESRVLRWLLGFSALMCGVSILGSQSRGAFLALAAMVFFLGLKGRKPIVYTVALLALLAVGVLAMPETWWSRMETMLDYEKEQSALSRIYIWKMIWALALDRPVIGVGFATNSADVFARYAPAGFRQFAGQYWVAHSIYFQALGEHGFPGLAMYLALGWLTWRRAGRLARDTAAVPEFRSWVPLLMKSLQVSLIGFAVGGAFLNLVHFDLPFYMVAFVVLVDATVREAARQRVEVGQPSPTGVSLSEALK
jgi:probable O-glycosylation ligase (exosortase A-associated)